MRVDTHGLRSIKAAQGNFSFIVICGIQTQSVLFVELLLKGFFFTGNKVRYKES
jgi:hypothetical protein